ncbi:ankyrin repeat-containing domain protein [Aspergillus keveii]|uniref:Ankyrin repeat-containing domain protein n=1 Tax=Aspergillus keveii TaxID=714993 RepID=A0ABR4FGU2_9EURO
MDPFLEEATDQNVNSLMRYAIFTDDTKLLDFLISLGQQLTEWFPEDPANPTPYYVYHDDLYLAMHLGRLHCLEILVKRTAAGVDFDELVDEGEIEGKEAPEHYRGLSVRGKKRDDWARRGQTATEPDTPPPLLYAAKMGNLESVQWFLGPAPARCYNAFVAGNKNDPGVRKLLLTKKGPANTICDFLESRCHLLLHSAVIAEENEESQALVEYLANNMRHLLDARNVDGYTPLTVAFRLGRFAFAKILIHAGADQTVRDVDGRNLLHVRIQHMSRSRPTDWSIREALELLDRQLLSSMLTARRLSGDVIQTPFSWLILCMSLDASTLPGLAASLDYVKPLGCKHLELLDSEGNTPCHGRGVISWELIDSLLAYEPELAAKENVNGLTPADVAEQKLFAKAAKPPHIPQQSSSRNLGAGAVGKEPWTFVHQTGKGVLLANRRRIYERCCLGGSDGDTRRRKLVTLFEVREFAAASHARFQRCNQRRTWLSPEMDKITEWLDL